MPIYQGNAQRGIAEQVQRMVADKPSTITRVREVFTDKFRAPTTQTAGPYTVRIEPFRATRVASTFDEKGSGVTAAFVLIGVDIPRWQDPDTKQVSTFKLNDKITDQHENTYRITSPARFDGRLVEVNLELVE